MALSRVTIAVRPTVKFEALGLQQRREQAAGTDDLLAFGAHAHERARADLTEALEKGVLLEPGRLGVVSQRRRGPQCGAVGAGLRALAQRLDPFAQRRRARLGGEPARRPLAIDRGGGRDGQLAAVRTEAFGQQRQRRRGRLDRTHLRAHAALVGQPAHRGEREAAVPAGGADARDPPLVGPAAQPARRDCERLRRLLKRDLLVLRQRHRLLLRRRREARADLRRRVDLGQERVDHLRVEVPPALGDQGLDGVLDAAGGAVDAVGGEGVERVGDRRDPARHRDLVGGQPVRVARAVVALVVGERDLGRGVEQFEPGSGQHRVPELGMWPRLRGGRALTGPSLAHDGGGDGGHADVVQTARDPDRLRVQSQRPGDQRAVPAHPLQVRADLDRPRRRRAIPPRIRRRVHRSNRTKVKQGYVLIG